MRLSATLLVSIPLLAYSNFYHYYLLACLLCLRVVAAKQGPQAGLYLLSYLCVIGMLKNNNTSKTRHIPPAKNINVNPIRNPETFVASAPRNITILNMTGK